MTIKWEISRTLYNRNGRTSIKDFDTVGYIERENELNGKLPTSENIYLKRATITVRPSLKTK